MARFLARRILHGLVVLWVITLVVFFMFFVAPSDVPRLIAGRQATPETVALVERRLGLDRPVPDKYASYMWNLLHGDVGYSFYNSTSVRSLIWERVPVTFSLAIGAVVLTLLIGVSSGVLAAIRPRSPADRAVTVAGLVFYSMPAFLLGLIFLYFFFFRLHLARDLDLSRERLRSADRGSVAVGTAPRPTVVDDRPRDRGRLLAAHARLDARRAR